MSILEHTLHKLLIPLQDGYILDFLFAFRMVAEGNFEDFNYNFLVISSWDFCQGLFLVKNGQICSCQRTQLQCLFGELWSACYSHAVLRLCSLNPQAEVQHLFCGCSCYVPSK